MYPAKRWLSPSNTILVLFFLIAPIFVTAQDDIFEAVKGHHSENILRTTSNNLDDVGGFSITGLHPDGRLGFYVSHIGDINNDGFDDISLCAPWATPDVISETGEIYIIFGHDTGLDTTFDLNQLDGTNGFRVRGVNVEDRLGYGGARAAGDVNNDGLDDFIITTPYADPDSLNTGSAYVIFGSEETYPSLLSLEMLDGTNGFTLNGTNYWDNFGTTGGYAGDMNGDNIDDIYVTADDTDFHGESSGTVYVIYGKDQFPDTLDVDTLYLQHGFLINGNEAIDNVGVSVGSLKDFNGDGVNDLVIGAFHANNDTGAGYVVFGQSTNFTDTVNTADLDGTNGFEILGEAVEDLLGVAAGDAGDLNGDGIRDLFISASRVSYDNLSVAGRTYVLYGKTTAFSPIIELSTLSETQGFSISGSQSPGFAGHSADGIGDVNGDNLDDLIIGALFESSNGFYRNGNAYVVFGRDQNFPADIILGDLDSGEGYMIGGDTTHARFGFRVDGGGDFNGDNVNDFIIGADYGAEQSGNAPGKAYVIYGQQYLGETPPPCWEGDYNALRALYLSTDGDNWNTKTGWPTATYFNDCPTRPPGLNLNSWYGVETNNEGCVTNIDLKANNLIGNIPPEIGNLEELLVLFLAQNQLNDSIPGQLGSLDNLIELHLYNNDLNGCYHPNLNNLCNQLVSPCNTNQSISDGNNFDAPWEDFCIFEDSACIVSINIIDETTLTVYPNPADDVVIFELENVFVPVDVVIMDVFGRQLIAQPLPFDNKIVVGHLDHGVYMYQLFYEEESYTGKLILR